MSGSGRVIIPLLLALLGSVSLTAAQIRYVDKDGVSHWVQSPLQIPLEYREKSEQLKLPEVDASKGEDKTSRAKRKAFDADQSRKRQAEKGSVEFREATERCKKAANNDAFVKPGNAVTFLGTSRQNFNFEKCMAELGFPVDVKP